MILSINGQPAHVLDDSNYRDYLPDDDFRVKDAQGREFYTGLAPPDVGEAEPLMATVRWEDSGLIYFSEQEIKEHLEEMWRQKSSLMHLTYHTDSLDQNAGTCWIHGTCGAARCKIIAANLPDRIPSPMSVAYHCYSNYGVNGGYPSLGVQKFQEHGAATTELWPENGRNRRYDTEQSRANREHQWLEEIVETGSGREGFWRAMSAICQGHPVGLSYSWWRHYVYGCWGRDDRGEVKIGIRNSWGNNGYGDKGFGLLAGSRKYPSWSCVFLRMRQTPGQ